MRFHSALPALALAALLAGLVLVPRGRAEPDKPAAGGITVPADDKNPFTREKIPGLADELARMARTEIRNPFTGEKILSIMAERERIERENPFAEPDESTAPAQNILPDPACFSEPQARPQLRLFFLADFRRNVQDLATIRTKIAERTRTLGPEHEKTLDARRVLADALFAMAAVTGVPKHQEHEEERRALIALSERLHGDDHPAGFPDRDLLARALYLQGKLVLAEQEYRALATAVEKAFGPTDDRTLRTRQCLALCLHGQSKYDEAEREYRFLITLRERAQEVRRDRVSNLRAWLAKLLVEKGQHGDAEVELRLLVAAYEREPGEKSAFLARSRETLAKCLLARGNAAEAVRELELALAYWKPKGATSSTTAESVSVLLTEARKALAPSGE